MNLLEGQVVVITGGASGIGRATALSVAHHGGTVIVGDRSKDPREADVRTIDLIKEETDAAVRFVKCDVTDRDAVERLIDAAEEFGGIDVMVNNAGVYRGGPFLDTSEETLDLMLSVNVKGTFFGSQKAAERMIENGDGGSIINISSIAGLRGASEAAAYCTSKGAVRQLTSALAAELGQYGIRVNGIYPGTIRTAQAIHDSHTIPDADSEDAVAGEIPLGRIGEPSEVAKVVIFLASELGTYVNGATLSVDGGQFATGG
ncbi:MAG: SDR family oxidoreductase [Halodesulfurarchaeum sp.]|nr:SDR family oxidoreductase [Halodesulfurarchaeum sp.]